MLVIDSGRASATLQTYAAASRLLPAGARTYRDYRNHFFAEFEEEDRTRGVPFLAPVGPARTDYQIRYNPEIQLHEGEILVEDSMPALSWGFESPPVAPQVSSPGALPDEDTADVFVDEIDPDVLAEIESFRDSLSRPENETSTTPQSDEDEDDDEVVSYGSDDEDDEDDSWGSDDDDEWSTTDDLEDNETEEDHPSDESDSQEDDEDDTWGSSEEQDEIEDSSSSPASSSPVIDESDTGLVFETVTPVAAPTPVLKTPPTRRPAVPGTKVPVIVSMPDPVRETPSAFEVPGTLREFIKKYPRCEVDFAKKYFPEKEIKDAIKFGKIYLKAGRLHV